MRFLITMNLPTATGKAVHQIVAEHPASSLEAFRQEIDASNFVMVEEFYKNNVDNSVEAHGNILLNTMNVGKVKVWSPEQLRR